MVKKKVKRPASKKGRFAAKKFVVTEKEFKTGFFERFKDILPEPKKETVRVKTFIVEKPVYVSAPPTRISAPKQKYALDEEEEQVDSKKSRYIKKRAPLEEMVEKGEELAEGEEDLQEGELGEDAALEGEETIEGEDALDENGEPLLDDLSGEEALPTTHIRSSRIAAGNIWWKKALFWAILIWLIILAFSMSMQAMKLVNVDLTRQWWVLLGGLIVVAMGYFKFLEGKI
ncbi:MAG: hypothetical protein WCW13_03415 [archaeon]|jgi:hypothetical protein